MTEDRFESRLEALFDAPPPLDDNPAFVARVERQVATRLRLRADLTAVAWTVAGGAVLWGLVSSFDTPSWTIALSRVPAVIGAGQGLGGAWLLPALAIGGVLAFQALEDAWARD